MESGENETLPTPNLCPVRLTREERVWRLQILTAGLWPDSPLTRWLPSAAHARQVTVFLSLLMM